MSSIRNLFIALMAIVMIGCATPASRDSMSISAIERTQYSSGKALSKSISVGHVSGGEKTNPAWTSEIGNEEFAAALKDSLETAHLLNNQVLSKYELDAILIEVNQPMFGFTMSVKTQVQYTLRDKTNGNIVMQETFSASGSATTGDAFVGTKRLKMASERSAQENIKRIIDVLYHLDI